jgi:WD40 repeat protein
MSTVENTVVWDVLKSRDPDRLTASKQHPFVGLRAYTYYDAPFFFGRDAQIEVLEEALAHDRLLSVIGSSGNGKSSLVRAGLLPRLRSDRRGDPWNWIEMRPGESPIRRLAEALALFKPGDDAGAADCLAQARVDRIELILRQSSYGISEALEHLPALRDRPLVVLVDQFEEIFRFADLRSQQSLYADSAQERRDDATFFIQLLLTARDDPDFTGHLVITMRSDFIGDCARFHGLSEAITATQYLVPSLTRDQRAEAIRGPLKLAGAEIEAVLVQRLLNDTNEDPDQLPIMQHALMRCWQHASRRVDKLSPVKLTMSDYESVGGIERSLSLHANEILAEFAGESTMGLDAAKLDMPLVVKRVFQSLTDTRSGGRVTRRPQSLKALVAVLTPDDARAEDKPATREAVIRVVARFADPDCSFLRAPQQESLDDETVIDIGHEALIRLWEKLGGVGEDNWVREEQRDAEKLYDLARVARLDGLLSQDRLPEFKNWWRCRRPNRFWAQRYSHDNADDILSAAKAVMERSQAEILSSKKRRRRRRRFAIALTALLLLIPGLGLPLYFHAEAARAAEAKERLISVIGAYQLDRESAHRALLTALFGLDSNTKSAPVVELEALAYRGLEHLFETTVLRIKQPNAVAFGGDGRLLVLAHGSLSAWSLADGSLRSATVVQVPDALDMTLSSDGQQALISTADRDTRIVYMPQGGPAVVGKLSAVDNIKPGPGVFSPDGTYVLTTGRGSQPMLWQRTAPGQPYRMVLDLSKIEPGLKTGTAAAFNKDSKLFAVSAVDGSIYVFDVGSMKRVQEIKPGAKFTTSLAFSPLDPDLLVGVSWTAGSHLWNVRVGNEVKSFALTRVPPSFKAAFSPDGKVVAIVGGDGVVRIYNVGDIDNPDSKPTVLKSGVGAWSVTFNRNAASRYQLATSTQSDAVWLWNMTPALSRDLRTEAVEASELPCGPQTKQSPDTRDAGGLEKRGGRFMITSNRAGIHSMPLDIPNDTECPTAIALSPAGDWLAWTAPKGILLFDLKKSPSPLAVLGETTSWRAVKFASDPDRIMAVDVIHRQRAWRYFRSPQDLVKFAHGSLPMENSTRVDLEHGSMPAKPLQVSLTIEECTKLLGVLPWVTRPQEREALTDQCSNVVSPENVAQPPI